MTRRRFLIGLLAAVWLSVGALWAVPARPGLMQVRQPDGSTLTIELHGDEYLNYTTTADGYTVVRNADGYYAYAEKQTDGQLTATSRRAHDATLRTADERRWLLTKDKHVKPQATVSSLKTMQAARRAQQSGRTNRTAVFQRVDFRGLVLLVEYADCKFSRSDYQQLMTDVFNTAGFTGAGYSGAGEYSGSVRDYYYDNSNKQLDMKFDVLEPVQISYNQEEAEGVMNCHLLTYLALLAADQKGVDFSNYDCDGDGTVDMLYFIFAGHGSHDTDNKHLLWPHTDRICDLDDATVTLDGVRLDAYGCSTELYRNEDGVDMLDGIGSICHEMGHIMGLADLYCKHQWGIHPDMWCLMAKGSYANNTRTPAGLSLYERYSLGFATPQTIATPATYQIKPVGESNSGYRINSAVEGEYFLLEYRHPIYKWDKYLPGQGMLVFRVDSTDAAPWVDFRVNDDTDHYRFELLRAGGDNDSTAQASDPFPGSMGVTALGNSTSPANLLSWSGEPTPLELRKIAEYGSVIAFDVVKAGQGSGDDDDENNTGLTSHGVKYWFDDQKEMAAVVKGNAEDLNIDVSGLSDGIHALHVMAYEVYSGTYREDGAQTRYFIKQPTSVSGRRADYLYYVDSVQVFRSQSNASDSHEASLPMTDVAEGLHRLTTFVKTPGEANTTVTSHYFMRVGTDKDAGSLRLTCSIDGSTPTVLQQGFAGDSLSYELDVKGLAPGLHRLTYQLTSSGGTLDTPPTTTFFMVDPKLKQYEYWLNGDRSTLTVVGSLKASNPYELATELTVRPMPVRSSAFHFAMESGSPVVYAVNDLTVRFVDNDGSFADSTMQYVDSKSKEAVTQTTPLEKNSPVIAAAPEAGKIKWFCLEAYRGDGIRLQASRPCSMQLFAPDGEEIYRVSGDAAKTIAGTNGRLTGTYYVAVHDISDESDSRELTVTYHEGASILTAKPESSLADNSTVLRGTTVTLSCATPKAVIWYSTDGSEPSLESETTHRYDGMPISIDGKMTLRAIATCQDMLVSDVATYHYNTLVKGDANGDGKVDMADVMAIVNRMLGKEDANFVVETADVNGDGVVNVADVMGVVNIILQGLPASYSFFSQKLINFAK